MAISAPVILLPSGGVDFTTDTRLQTLSGTTSSNTGQIRVNGSQSGVSYTSGDTDWAWTGALANGLNAMQVVAVEKVSGVNSFPATINITYAPESVTVTVSSPTGVSLRRYQDKIEVITSKSAEEYVRGYNFYVSYQSGGVNNEYVKINPSLVPNDLADTAFYEDAVTLIGTTTETVGQLRTTTTTEQVVRNYYYSVFFDYETYNEMVSAGQLPSIGFSQNVNFYFVVTAVVYDPVLAQVSESSYSPELEGSPVTITTGIKDLPSRTQNDILLTFSQELLASNAGIDTKPGTVIRDIINPISEEQARIYVIQDFMARSLSVSSLLDFDDPEKSGTSQPVNQSAGKTALQMALYMNNADDVQTLIDEQFDKLASNVNLTRMAAQSAIGSVLFYTQNAPIRDMAVAEGAQVASMGDTDQGIPSQSYRCLETKVLPLTDADLYYNSLNQRYELEVNVVAINSGSSGNTDSNTIKSVGSGIDAGFLVENPNPIQFGTNIESNKDLATRLELAFFADTGTEGGYAKTVVSVPGVHGVRVEKAGDSLMFRDYDSIRKEHIGGKVDIYIQGKKIRQVTDQIAFSFSSGTGSQQGERFDIINAVAFQFKTENPRVTAHTPIFEVSRIHNATRGASYDLTGYVVFGDGDSVDIDETLPANTLIGLATADVILVDYKYRSSDTFVLTSQPVESIVSVVGQVSGPLTTDNWDLVKLQDPLEEGNSTIASDGIKIKFANNLPVTDFQTITDEPHVMVQGVEEDLKFLGIDPTSIIVTDQAKTVTYVKDADYTVIAGTDVTPTKIKTVDTGLIVSGQTVLVSYIAIENFIITYTTNSVLADVQTKVDEMKHACADVIVKESIQNAVDFQIAVVPKPGVTNFEKLSSQIQTSVSNFIAQAGIGISISQSDMDHAIRKVSDVDYVILPFIRMAKADGSLIVRDDIGSPTFKIYAQGISAAYETAIPVLEYKTTANGGSDNLFRGVFEDKIALILQDDPMNVSKGPGRAYIQADGKIVVSTSDGKLPETKKWQVAYYASGESGAKDIQVASLEYLKTGTFIITYDNARTGSQSI